ncbi:L-threonylcarbamoyladenylate synthase [Paenibacillus sp. IHBB 10380]|uniref:L-threonylcarbamoyladenylate synthase n=1 Tax=Paenibacillus sp. IHBB 10380 TaxID=1566358 RepID=UPI001F1975B1|nr:L-threonylcarbamoyladenylate synthase [Paenibacillus sp. IHBB 10380]
MIDQKRQLKQELSREAGDIQEAAKLLASGGIIAFPTETVYGLGADARSTSAVEAVFTAKGRPADNPLIVHIAERIQLAELVTEVHPIAAALMEAFWPGPLTLVLPLREGVLSSRVTAGLDTVGVRMPDHPVALELIAKAGCPVAAPSANRSGRPSPTLADHVMEDLEGRIDGILDGGPTGVGLESTVVQVQADGAVVVLRPGGITTEQLSRIEGVVIHSDLSDTESASEQNIAPSSEIGMSDTDHAFSLVPRSPGMKYTHYAPRGALSIVRGSSPQTVADWIATRLDDAVEHGETIGLMIFDEHKGMYHDRPDLHIVTMGPLSSLDTVARFLYAGLRQFDEAGVTFILAEACPEEGLGTAVMNRLLKAAGGRVISV